MKNKIIWGLAILTFTIAGCKDDFLQAKRDLNGVNEEVFKDPLMATAYVDYVYGLFQPGDGATSLIGSSEFAQTTEEMAGETNYNKVWAQISYTNAHALPYFSTVWTRMRQINLFLENIDNYGLPLDTRRKLKGQLYFWRGWQYFDLIRLYGGVPLALQSQNPIAIPGDSSLFIPRSKTSVCIEKICSDLDSAVSMLPGKWTGADWGRITSGAALATKGKVLLTWASPLFNRADDVARWQRAYDVNTAAIKLLKDNGFGLFVAGKDANGTAFGNMWFSEATNPEAVISYGFNNVLSDQTKKYNGWEQAARSKESKGGGSISPTKQMVDAFPMKDGKMPGASIYPYDPNKFYKDRDPRFYKTFAYNGSVWPYKENPKFRQWTYKWYKAAADTVPTGSTETLGANASGIYVSKATNPVASNSPDFKISPTDYLETRYAEVLLDLAESAIGVGKLSEAGDEIGLIRDRAGIAKGSDNYGIGTALSRDQMFAAVLNERKIEFAYEGKRFYDLRRWMLFDNSTNSNTRLGIPVLNGTRRTGYYIVVKKNATTNYVGAADPLLPGTGGAAAPVVQREPETFPPGITTQDQYVDYLYDNYFKIVEKDDLDKAPNVTTGIWKFIWYPEYYFFGFNQSVLNTSPYLEQTKGWNSINGPGTFDPLQ